LRKKPVRFLSPPLGNGPWLRYTQKKPFFGGGPSNRVCRQGPRSIWEKFSKASIGPCEKKNGVFSPRRGKAPAWETTGDLVVVTRKKNPYPEV